MKLCLIYNYAQHYRTGIFTLMDKELKCDFVFGDSMSDVKKMDYSLLKGNVTENHTIGNKSFSYQLGMLKRLNFPYTHYLLLGDTRSISTWLFCILARMFYPRRKVYFWTHGWYGKESKIERMLKRIFFKLPNGGIFTYGNYGRDLMIQNGVDPNKVWTIHNSLAYDQQLTIRKNLFQTDVYSSHFNNANPNLFFVGRLTNVKKLDQLLNAVYLCAQRGKKYNVTLIGGGEKYEDLQIQAKKLRLENQVWFYGPCYDEYELSNLIYNADLCVAPGNIGLTAMHSLVFGTPALTHNDFRWQMPEFEAIVDGCTGTFFERDNIQDLSCKIDDWFEIHGSSRNLIRERCMEEIDREWNPYFQLEVLKKGLSYE